MKRLFLLFSFALAVASANAAEPFAMSTEGTVAKYRILNDKGREKDSYTVTVQKVEKVDPQNFVATHIYSFGDRVTPDVPVKMVVVDGAIDLRETMNAIITRSDTAGMNVSLDGYFPRIPADVKVGDHFDFAVKIVVTPTQELREAMAAMAAMGQKLDLSGSMTGSWRVVANESVTVPAGTFQCIKIENRATTSMMGASNTMHSVSWYAHGVGMVKEQTLDGHDNVAETTELTDI